MNCIHCVEAALRSILVAVCALDVPRHALSDFANVMQDCRVLKHSEYPQNLRLRLQAAKSTRIIGGKH
eukprot:3656678-Pleurochrysis_carterae.AAC.1